MPSVTEIPPLSTDILIVSREMGVNRQQLDTGPTADGQTTGIMSLFKIIFIFY